MRYLRQNWDTIIFILIFITYASITLLKYTNKKNTDMTRNLTSIVDSVCVQKICQDSVDGIRCFEFSKPQLINIVLDKDKTSNGINVIRNINTGKDCD